MKKSSVIVGIIIISVFFLFTCDMSDYSIEDRLIVGLSDNRQIDHNWNIEDGYNILNIYNGFFISYYGGWVYAYYRDSLDFSLHRMRPDGSQLQKIQYADGLYDGVYHDGWFYYIDAKYEAVNNGADHMPIGNSMSFYGNDTPSDEYYSRLFRMRPDGSRKTKLADDVYNFEIVDGWIYYNSGYSIYRMKFDGSNKKKIADNCSNNYLISNGYIFARVSGGKTQYDTKLVRFDMDGTSKILIESDNIYYTPVYTDGEYLYYRLYFGEAYINYLNNGYVDTNELKGEQLHRMKYDGSDRQIVIEHEGRSGSLTSIAFKDGFIYYSRYFDTRLDSIDIGYPWFVSEIYKIRTDGTDQTKIRDMEIYSGVHFDLIGNSIFYTKYYEVGKNYRGAIVNHLSLDGEHNIVYDTKGNEPFGGYFVHNRKLYIVTEN